MMQAHPDVSENVAALFERHRPSIMGLAYRMLGSLAEAQDIAQETYLRFRRAVEQDKTTIDHPGAFLYRVAGRLCLDQLNSARARRETYVGTWLPEPVLDEQHDLRVAETAYERAQDISFALMLTLERLTPPERAAFLLHDVFDLSFKEVAESLGQTEVACRQAAVRARRHLREGPVRPSASPPHRQQLVANFVAALAACDVEGMRRLLADQAVLYADGGGKVLAALKPVHGGDRIARFYGGLRKKYPPPDSVHIRFASINGLPGVVVETDAVVIQTFAFACGTSGKIEAIYTTRNPDKLRGVAHRRG